ncbi:MAG TPA: insulinase family protein, partial [Terracidiphilus sp.]|nr:insulinase family protein [Terracidiphilus sp.]
MRRQICAAVIAFAALGSAVWCGAQAAPATHDQAMQSQTGSQAQNQAGNDPYLKRFENEITVKVLPNGLTLIVCDRPEAPVFSYVTYVDAGDVDDPSGESGLAHMFEHLAFKGTSQIGTSNWPAEKIALAKVEAANNAYEAEYLKPVGRDPKKLEELHKAFLAAQAEAEKYVIPNQFSEVAETNGATGLNAETG